MTDTHDDDDGKLLARLDERTEWIKKALEGMQLRLGSGDARMDKLEQDAAVMKTKSGFIGVISAMLTNLVAALLLWYKFGRQ